MLKWLRIAGIALAFSLLLGAVEPALAAEGRIPIWTRGAIVADGKYILTRDLLPGPGPAIQVVAGVEHVDIDLNGFTVFGDPGGGDVIEAIGFRRSVTIRNGEVRAQGPPGNGIYIEECGKVVIEDVKVLDAQEGGIFLREVYNFALRRNIIVGANTDAIVVDNTITATNSHGTLEGNVIRESGAGINVLIGASIAVLNNHVHPTSTAHGIRLEQVTAALISMNTVEGAVDTGILLEGVSSSKIHNNVVTKCGGNGITLIGGSDNNLLLDNVASANSGDGIMTDGRQNQIDRNVLNSNGLSGLHIRAGSAGNTYGRNTMRANVAAAGACVNPATACGGPDFCDDNAAASGNVSFQDNFAPGPC